jgi:flavin-dependent dehydrogenase
MYDIGIIGAGPAGATCARLLASRYRVLLLDSGRQKCCGGILNRRAQAALAKCGLALPKHVLADPQPFAVTIMDWDNRLVRSYARQYVNIDRAAFDRWLLSLVPQTADIRRHAIYQKSEETSAGLTLHFKENDEPKTAHVRCLVGADGAFSAVRREFFPNTLMPKRYIAVQHWFERETISVTPEFGIDCWNNYTGIFDSALTDFYLWMIPKGQQLILGGAFPPGTNVSLAMQIFREKLESLGLRFGTPVKREAGQILRPFRPSSLCFGDARTILVGEASGLISLSSAEGISAAIISAFYLAETFQKPDFNPSLYRRMLRKQWWSLWSKKLKMPLMFNPHLRNYVIRSGLMALR